jgi:hypothetical protein
MHSDLSYDLGLIGGKKMSPNCRQQGAFLCFYMRFRAYKKA